MANNSTELTTPVHMVERVSLYDYGYEKSGVAKGDPDLFKSFLTRIANGDLVEENYKGISDEEKKDRRQQIKELEAQKKEIDKNNAQVEAEIKEKEDKIDELRQDILKIREVRNEDHEKIKRESFSPLKFSINLFILSMLSIYLFFFYVSTAYKALYVDFEKIAENIAQGVGIGSIMPQPYELAEAIQYNYLLFLVPFVFYAFGWAFHILLEMRHNIKILYISLLVGVTFAVDFLLAFIIHKNVNMAKDLMGLETEAWSESATFYIILSLGFLVYIIWSILFDSLMKEWDKKKILSNIRKIIKHLQKDVARLQAKLTPADEIKARIAMYQEDLSTVMYGSLKKYIEQFSSGWLAYLTPKTMAGIKDRCLSVKIDFEEKHGIKPGLVKVISKRG